MTTANHHETCGICHTSGACVHTEGEFAGRPRCPAVSDQGLRCAQDLNHEGNHHALGEHLPGVSGYKLRYPDGPPKGNNAPFAEHVLEPHEIAALSRQLATEPDADSGPVCARCGDFYSADHGKDPSVFCHDCAHEVAETIAPKLLFMLSSAEAERFDAKEANRALSIEVEASGLLKRRQLDEELQQIDDAVVAAGGKREQGAVSFIAELLATKPGTPERARPFDDWHEDMGHVLWWRFPIDEPPFVGDPRSSDWPGYHTHWTPLPPCPEAP